MIDELIWERLILHNCRLLHLLRTSNAQEASDAWIWQTVSMSYLPCPANPFPDTEVHKHPGDGQCYCQWHSNLAWFFQAIGHFMYIAPTRSERSTMRPLYTQKKISMQQRSLLYVSLGCKQGTLKLCCCEAKQSSQYLTPKTPQLHW